jgi:EAL domain-containing protein (putative c-di-GMP-specific phosphodiesterase class I)
MVFAILRKTGCNKLRLPTSCNFFYEKVGGILRMNALIHDVPVISAAGSDADDSSIMQTEQYGRQTRLRSDLAKAISSNQFRVHYQPEIDLQTNEIFAAEAFIRWEHPVFGILLPREFVSIAEESDFILEMGDWILNEVCRNYSEWLKEGLPPIKISVNYSSIQFFQKDFVENIRAITERHGLKPDFIIIEILERVSINNFNLVRTNIDKLHELGINVALDDFGTGFSSLEYLSKLHIDILKIDRLFTQTTPNDKTNAIIIETILNLAEKLGILAVAEGIETQEQLDFLKNISCPAGQGFYFSRPMPSQECKSLLRERTCSPEKLQQPAENNQEKRKYSRHRFPLYLEASMTILKYHGQDVHFGSTLVLIQDIGAGGLCFFTTLCIPVKSNLMIQFTTTLLGKQVVFYGTPVWGKEVKGNLYKYGVHFKISEEKQTGLDAFIRQLQLETDGDVENLSGDFVRQSPYSYFQVQ